MRNICLVNDCGGLYYGHGLCKKHYMRWWRHGTPHKALNHGSVVQRLIRNMVVDRATGCWNWTGRTASGYGQLGDNSKQKSTHRISYRLYNGEIPEGFCVCHTCDNKICINPKHLFVGTIADNTKDRDQKGRQARGERSSSAKLTEGEVGKIRFLCGKGVKQNRVAHLFNVSPQVVNYIVNRKTWKHI